LTHKHRTAPLDEGSASRRNRYPYNTQHTQQTNVSALRRIRTSDPSNRAAVDLRLRRHGQRDRHKSHYVIYHQIISSVRLYQCGSRRKNYQENRYWELSWKYVEKIQFW